MQQVTNLWNRVSVTTKITVGSLLVSILFLFVCFIFFGVAVSIPEITGQTDNPLSAIALVFACLSGLGAILLALPAIFWGIQRVTNIGKKSASKSLFPLDVQNAFAAIALSIIAVDGYISEIEIQAFSITLAKRLLFRNYNVDNIAAEEIAIVIHEQGFEYLVSEAKHVLSYDLRETAFAMAADLALADGYADENEQYYLAVLYQILEIPQQTADKIIDVINIKNRG